MVSCAACGISKPLGKKLGISFHRFPRDPKLHQAWVRAMSVTLSNVKTKPLLCSLHFSESCFDKTSQLMKRLKEGALPTRIIDRQKYLRSGEVTITEIGAVVEMETDKLAETGLTTINSGVCFIAIENDSDAERNDSLQPRNELAEAWTAWTADNCNATYSPSSTRETAEFFESHSVDSVSSVDASEEPEQSREVTDPRLNPFRVTRLSESAKEIMERIKNLLCRICGTKQKILTPIIDINITEGEKLSLSEIIEMYLPIEMRMGEDLPPNICLNCRNLVASWHNLYVNCLAADSVLQKMFSVGKSKIVPGNLKEATDQRRSEYDNNLQVYRESSFPEVALSQIEKQSPINSLVNVIQDEDELSDNPTTQDKDNHDNLQVNRESSVPEPHLHGIEKQSPNKYLMNVIQNEDELSENPAEQDNDSYVENEHAYVINSEEEKLKLASSVSLAYKCRYCGVAFRRRDDCILHRKQCELEPAFCDICGKIIMRRIQLRRHLLTHTEGKWFVCDKCGKKLSSKSQLHCHVNVQHLGLKEPKKICEPCCKRFFTINGYLKHQKLHQDGNVKSLNLKFASVESDGEVSYICPVCGDSFPDKVSVILHMHVTKKTRCATCKDLILNERNSLTHKCGHWSCRHCGKEFTVRTYMYLHEQIHRNRSVICKTCGGKFASNKSLLHHQAVHKPPLFRCEECGKEFKWKESLVIHKQNHEGITYDCPHCNKTFKSKGSLQTHCRKVHSDF